MLVMIFASYRNAVTTIDCDAAVLKSSPDVIMLGAWWCPYCAQARKYFHSNNVHYCEYDIERSAEGARLYDKMNGAGIPVLIIDGKNYSGFDSVAFERLMENRKK
jgi:glutaredoxin